jgi:predicted P-loop ATPase
MSTVIGTLRETLDLTIQRLQITEDELLKSVTPVTKQSPPVSTPSRFADDDVIAKIRVAKNGAKFARLFDYGDTDAYGGDESRADLGLASMLAFYTGEDIDQLERLMRRSKLYREKWDAHPTYLRERTLTAAISYVRGSGFYGGTTLAATPSSTAAMIIAAPANPVLTAPAAVATPPISSPRLISTRRGVIDPVVSNVVEILIGDPNLADLFHFDEFSRQRNLNRKIPEGASPQAGTTFPRRWTDADSIDLQIYIQRHHIERATRAIVEDALTEFDARVIRHPVREYFNSLVWDGQHRLDSWLTEYLDADPSCSPAVLEAIGPKFMISAVARVMHPGSKVDHALVLEGPQGAGKSKAAATLAGEEWFTDGLPRDLGDKDAAMHLQGRLIVELSELSQLKRSQIETVKAFLTRQTDKFRPPYGRAEVEVPRQCVFIGTTNESEYLVDISGNRRFWPVRCGQIDIAALRRDRDQLWAEAFHRYRQKEAWHIEDDEVRQLLADEVARRTVTDPWLPYVADVLANTEDEVTPGEVLQRLADIKVTDYSKGLAARVANLMRDLGWVQSRRDRKRGQLYRRNN